MNDKDFAFIIGINEYKNLPPLEGAINDALAFTDWLLSPNGGHVPAENIYLLTSLTKLSLLNYMQTTTQLANHLLNQLNDIVERLQSEKLTLKHIERKSGLIDLINDFVDEKSPDRDERIGRRLYLFFAGHGISANSTEAVLLMPDVRLSERSKLKRSISGSIMATELADSGLFEEVLLFMDCCRDIMQPGGALTSGIDVDYEDGSTKKVFAYATSAAKKSREKHIDECKRGIFSYALIDGLTGAAATSDGAVTSRELKNYLVGKVAELNPSRREQVPKLEPCDHVVIVETGIPIVTVTIERHNNGELIVVGDAQGQPLDPPCEVVAQSAELWQVTLPAGRLYTFWQLSDDGGKRFITATEINREKNHVTRS